MVAVQGMVAARGVMVVSGNGVPVVIDGNALCGIW